jgi:hypothetical protein
MSEITETRLQEFIEEVKREHPGTTVRRADSLDIPFLQAELAKAKKWEQVDLKRSLVWIAEYEGTPFMFLALRIVWQIEPILKFRTKGIPKAAQKRGMYLLYRETEKFLSDPEQNKTGIYWTFMHTTFKKVATWAERMGWLRCYKGGRLYAKGFDKKVE